MLINLVLCKNINQFVQGFKIENVINGRGTFIVLVRWYSTILEIHLEKLK
jgi:hypothetical protein